MALGFTASVSATFLPILKYHAHEGRFLRLDRTPEGMVSHDITDNFAAVIDMDAIEIGWMQFGHGIKPDLRLFPLGGEWPQAPSPRHRRGVRIIMQLSQAQGGEVRELSSTSHQFLGGFNALHDDFLAERPNHPGKLPVVVLSECAPEAEPRFTIAGWVERPESLMG